MKVNNGKKHLEMSRKQPKLTAKVKVNKSKHESQNVEEFLGYDTDSIFSHLKIISTKFVKTLVKN